MRDRSRYFAALPASELPGALLERIKRARDGRGVESMLDVWRTAYAHLYPATDRGGHGSSGTSRRPLLEGEQGQLVRMRMGAARSQAQALHALVGNAAMSWEVQATNSDAESQSAAVLGQRLLEEAWRSKGLDDACGRWLEAAVGLGWAWAWPEWDETAGGTTSHWESDDGRRRLVTFRGDVRLHVLMPWEVVVDFAAPSLDACPWRIAVTWRSRYDVAEAYGREADGSAGRRYEQLLDVGADDCLRWVVDDASMVDDEDLVPVLHLFHAPTPALPLGRYVATCGEAVLKAGPLDRYYAGGIPVERLALEEQMATPLGYSRWWDTLGAMEMRDELISAVTSNNNGLARQNIVAPLGLEITGEQYAGLSVIRLPAGVDPRSIAPLQLTRSAPETFDLIESLKADAQEGLGLNDVALGSPERGGSGASYAILAGAAKEQTSPLQRRYISAVGQLGLSYLRVLRQHVTEERVLAVAGRAARNIYSQAKWTGERLEGVDSVRVTVGNALQQTIAGRAQLADVFAERGWLPGGPMDYQQVLDTGRLDAVTDPQRAEYLAAESDVEALQRGEVPAVHAFHDHPFRARRGAAVLSSEVALQDPAVVDAVYQYVATHYLEYFGVPMETDPMRQQRLRELLGQMPPAPLEAPMGLPPGEPLPPDGGAPPELAGPTGQPDELGMPTMPTMPTNPLTGEQYDPLTGGGMVPPPTT